MPNNSYGTKTDNSNDHLGAFCISKGETCLVLDAFTEFNTGYFHEFVIRLFFMNLLLLDYLRLISDMVNLF